MSADDAPRILCIAGSPRRSGNSEQLLDVAVEGVRSAGGDPFKLVTVEYDLAPCRGCNACSATGECVIDDRMGEVNELLDSAEGVIVASPVYFATVPAVLKALYDRCQPYWARRYVLGEKPTRPKRPGALLVVRGGGDALGHEAAALTTRSVFGVLNVAYSHEVAVAGPDEASDIREYPESLERAREIGAVLVREALELRSS